MTPEEYGRYVKRREQNRVAAERFRFKQKDTIDTLTEVRNDYIHVHAIYTNRIHVCIQNASFETTAYTHLYFCLKRLLVKRVYLYLIKHAHIKLFLSHFAPIFGSELLLLSPRPLACRH